MMMQDIQVSSTQGVPCILFSSQATPPPSRLYPGTCYCASEIVYPLPEELETVDRIRVSLFSVIVVLA